RPRRHHRHPRLRGVPLGLHPREPVRLRRRLRGAHLRDALRGDPPRRPREEGRGRALAPRRPGGRVSAAGWQEKGERVTALESIASHAALVLAVAFALYPVLWVVSLAFSGTRPLVAQVLPVPHQPTTRHLVEVVTTTHGATWLFGRQLANSVVVSLATAAV